MKSLLFVTIQFVCPVYYVISGQFLIMNSPILGFQLLGIGIVMWAVITMNPSQWTIFPEPKKMGSLIVSGPYKWIRHPMYSGLLFMCLPIVVDRFTLIDTAIMAVFIINLIMKLSFEEKLLIERFPEDIDYRKTTWRIVSFVY